MMFPSFSEFEQLAQTGNFVPVCREWIADLDTPVSAWLKVCQGEPYSFLLESVEGGESIGRYSFLGCDPLWVLEARGDRTVQHHRNGTRDEFSGDPFAVLERCLDEFKPIHLPNLPQGIGGLFGFWGYELIQWIESRVPVHPIQSSGIASLPDGLWMQVDNLLVFDQVQRKIWAIAYADLRDPEVNLAHAYDAACTRVTTLVDKLKTSLEPRETILEWQSPHTSQAPALTYTSNTTPDRFQASVLKAKDYIKAGDIFQVVISQRLSAPYAGKPFDLYRSLRSINPSPYMAFFNFNDWQLVGSSPEVMVKADRQEDSRTIATVRPIAGTRKRGATRAEDDALAADLLADPKECAEHVMLVDLGRNDLGRVCQNGSVRVDELMTIERYSHVMHIVSNVVGQLQPEKTAWDLLKACFPAGTVSGAPKIRAMEIVRELEPDRRGPYSGVYGYYSFDGQLNSAIAIRTALICPDENGQPTVSVQAGAGLVADSNPQSEYEETLNKAKGVLEAIRALSAPEP